MIILPFLLLFIFSPSPISAKLPVTVNVGVILDLNTSIGLTSRAAINLAMSDFYSSRPNSTTQLRLHTRDSNSDVVSAAAAAVDLLVNNHAQAIIGPQTSPEVAFVADLGTKSHVPILSFSATSSSVSPARSPFFVRTAPSDVAQAAAIAALVHAFNWRRVVLIYEDDDYGASLVPSLIDALAFVDAAVPYRSAIPTAASDAQIAAELYRLTTLQTRVFILHATSTFAPRLLSRASAAEMMTEGFVWIATAALTSARDSLDPTITGILTVKPYIPRSPELHDFRKRWRSQFLKEVPELNNFGIWAYDTVTAIAWAAETITMDAGFDTNQMQTNYSTKLSDIGVARSGQELLDSILAMEFDGMGGRFRLVGGERNVTAFQVVNLIGETERVIGFWTAKHGLTRQLNWSSEMGYSASRTGLGAVIWPGEVTEVPRGWVEPVAGRKLRIAVPGPVEIGFHAFLDVDYDPVTNETVASGFVIDVFEAAVAELPYALIFEYVAYENGAGKSAGNYDQLVQQVYDEKFDAVVGDVTITANRSNYVDFTLPYTESGVRMVVPVKDEKNKNAWIFLKPLSADLWAVSCVFFVFTGVVVWILEHQINEEFRGPPSHQIGTVFYFSFSTLVFAHRETLMNNLSRIVITIWVFVVLILQSSYVASLTSMLTVQRLQPTVTDLSELIRNKEHVGYLKDSFVHGLLLKKGFHESNLKPYKSPRQYEAALRKGSSGGGVAAVVDEIPYLKVFLKDYCDNYTMVGLTYKTGGFGFAFPRDSPIVPDLSRAILSVTEGDKMVEIEKKWFGDQTTCPNKETASPFAHLISAQMASQLLPRSLVSVPLAAPPPRLWPVSAFASVSLPSSPSRFSISRPPPSFLSPLPRRRLHPLLATVDTDAADTAGDAEPPAAEVEETETVEEEKPKRKPIIKLGDVMGILNKRAVEAAEKVRPVPDIRTGDVVQIKLEVPENKRRLSLYKGIVMSRQNAGIHTTIRIRRIIAGIGVEIVFPLYSPNIKEIKVVSHRKVRRARLYYLRDKLPRLSTFK